MKKAKKDKYNKLKEIDVKIRESFGKFYVYSIIIILFLIILSIMLYKIKIWFYILLLVFILLFYIYMIVDLVKNKSRYWTILSSILIFLFIVLYITNVIELVFYLLK